MVACRCVLQGEGRWVFQDLVSILVENFHDLLEITRAAGPSGHYREGDSLRVRAVWHRPDDHLVEHPEEIEGAVLQFLPTLADSEDNRNGLIEEFCGHEATLLPCRRGDPVRTRAVRRH